MSSDQAPPIPPAPTPRSGDAPNTPDQPPASAAPDAQPYPPYPSSMPYPDAGYAPYPSPYPAPGYSGYPGYYPWMYAPPAPRMSTWALVSMICGAVSIASFQTVLAILAIIFGFVGLSEVKKSYGQVEGRGLALAGLITGFVSLGIGLLIVVLYILYIVVIFSTLSTLPG